jgi:hypothetical protein
MELKIGTVKSKADLSRTGLIKVAFGVVEGGRAIVEDVRYVSPYGNNKEGALFLPPVGAQVLVAHEPNAAIDGDKFKGYFYLGSVMGAVEGVNQQSRTLINDNEDTESTEYVPKNKPGTHGPALKPDQVATAKPDGLNWLPDRFKGLYDAKGVVPEQLGFTNHRGDAFVISSRYNSTTKSDDPIQNYSIGFESGNGKRFQAVDSPTVDGIVMTNEHKGKDFFIWSTGLSPESPFAEGEYHMRTHGPVNLYTLANRFRMWVEDGLNVQIENKSTGSKEYGPEKHTKLGAPGTGGYKASRQGKFGNQTTGCVQLVSYHNNISLEAKEDDSVIYINTPGANSRIIIEGGGSVDVVAAGKLTLQSDTEVEINAPLVDINGGTEVNINGTAVNIDGGPMINLNSTATYSPYEE